MCIQALSGYGQDRPYTGLYIHSQPMLYGLYTQALPRPAHHWRYRDPRTGLDTVANPRTNQWFVSAGGRMRAAAGAHYACACVYRRPHARGRYEGHEVISLPHPLPLSHGYIQW